MKPRQAVGALAITIFCLAFWALGMNPPKVVGRLQPLNTIANQWGLYMMSAFMLLSGFKKVLMLFNINAKLLGLVSFLTFVFALTPSILGGPSGNEYYTYQKILGLSWLISWLAIDVYDGLVGYLMEPL